MLTSEVTSTCRMSVCWQNNSNSNNSTGLKPDNHSRTTWGTRYCTYQQRNSVKSFQLVIEVPLSATHHWHVFSANLWRSLHPTCMDGLQDNSTHPLADWEPFVLIHFMVITALNTGGFSGQWSHSSAAVQDILTCVHTVASKAILMVIQIQWWQETSCISMHNLRYNRVKSLLDWWVYLLL